MPDPPIARLADALASSPCRMWRSAAVPDGPLTWHVEADGPGWYVELVSCPPAGRMEFLCAMRIVDGRVVGARWLADGPTYPDDL